MTKEYKIYSYEYKHDTTDEENDLNILADEGWEIVNIISGFKTEPNYVDTKAVYHSGVQIFLQREK